MRVFFTSAAAVAVAALFPIIGSAQQGQAQGPQGPPPQGRGGMRAAQPNRQIVSQRGPQLTSEQREQMRTFDEQQRAAGETARRELGDLHRQLNDALTAAQIDSGKVNQLRSAIVQRETALSQQRVDRLARLASLLTAEQRASLRGRGIGELFGPGGPGGRGGARGEGIGPRLRRGGELPLRGRMLQRQPLRERADDARLRGEIRRLEARLEALRRRIGR